MKKKEKEREKSIPSVRLGKVTHTPFILYENSDCEGVMAVHCKRELTLSTRGTPTDSPPPSQTSLELRLSSTFNGRAGVLDYTNLIQ